MNAEAFDILKYSRILQEAGVPREQAEAIAKVNVETFRTLVITQNLAMKRDTDGLETELKQEISGLRAEIKRKISELDNRSSKLQSDISDVKHEMVKWIYWSGRENCLIRRLDPKSANY